MKKNKLFNSSIRMILGWFGNKSLIAYILLVIILLCVSDLYSQPQCITSESLPVSLKKEVLDMRSGNRGFLPEEKSFSFRGRYGKNSYWNSYIDFQKITLRSRFFTTTAFDDSPLYLLVGPTIYASRIYLNGCLFISRGYDSNDPNTRIGSYDYYLIPRNMLRGQAEVNELLVELTSTRGYWSRYPSFTITNQEQAVRKSFFLNCININLPMIIYTTAIISALIFLLIYFTKRNRKKNPLYLVFVGMTLSLSMCCIEAAYTPILVHSFVMERVAMVGLFLFGLMQLIFIDRYYRLLDRYKYCRKIRNIIAALFIGIALPMVFIQEVPQVIRYYHMMVDLFFFPWMLLLVSIYFYKAYKYPNKKTIILCVAYISSFIGGLANIYFYQNHFDINSLWITYSIQLLLYLYFFVLEFGDLVEELTDKSHTLQHQNEEMEEIIEERTRELAVSNIKLTESVEGLKTVNQLKDKFFSIMAHDIKNPLGTIMGLADVLEVNYNDLDDDQKREIIHQMNTDAVGLYKILENMLEWSRCQIGRMNFSPALLPLPDIMAEILPMAHSKAKVKQIQIKCDYLSDQTIFADENMLKAIFRNLIGNAIKFSYTQGVVAISVRCFEDGGSEIRIADRGVGMSKDKVRDLFRIDRIESTKGTNNESGTGLGLIVCKEFVEYHRGTIQIESRQGQGTTFIVRLSGRM